MNYRLSQKHAGGFTTGYWLYGMTQDMCQLNPPDFFLEKHTMIHGNMAGPRHIQQSSH